jgi:hypothetical protein
MPKISDEPDESRVKLALVLGYIATKDLATIEKKIAVLDQLGYSNTDMARICNTTSDAIRGIKSRTKKGATKNATKV